MSLIMAQLDRSPHMIISKLLLLVYENKKGSRDPDRGSVHVGLPNSNCVTSPMPKADKKALLSQGSTTGHLYIILGQGSE